MESWGQSVEKTYLRPESAPQPLPAGVFDGDDPLKPTGLSENLRSADPVERV